MGRRPLRLMGDGPSTNGAPSAQGASHTCACSYLGHELERARPDHGPPHALGRAPQEARQLGRRRQVVAPLGAPPALGAGQEGDHVRVAACTGGGGGLGPSLPPERPRGRGLLLMVMVCVCMLSDACWSIEMDLSQFTFTRYPLTLLNTLASDPRAFSPLHTLAAAEAPPGCATNTRRRRRSRSPSSPTRRPIIPITPPACRRRRPVVLVVEQAAAADTPAA